MTGEANASRAPRRQRRERGSISADEIVSGAFALAGQITVEKLSMPILARHLDCGVTSIYWYFRSKEALLEAMRERALTQYEIALPFTGDGPWHERLRDHFHAMRGLFLDNPVLCDLLVANTSGYGDNPTRITRDRLEAILTTLIAAGFTPRDAVETYFSLAAHSRGFALLERQENLESGADPAAARDEVDERATPVLARLARAGFGFRLAQDRTFEVGLEALIEHAKRVLRATEGPCADRGGPGAPDLS